MNNHSNSRLIIESRRRFLIKMGVSAATMPILGSFVNNVHARQIGLQSNDPQPQKRLVIMFSPNGTLPKEFWPDKYIAGEPLELKSMLSALEPFRQQTLILKGVHNEIGGDGDHHMRGMSCLLTGARLNKGNIQGGGKTPAGWASGISFDQEMRRFFQSRQESQTRFGSLEFGVAVPNRADPWTRMCYAGSNRPLPPIDDPAQMLKKLYGSVQDLKTVGSVLDHVVKDLKSVSGKLGDADRRLLERHLETVRKLELDIAATAKDTKLMHPEPEIDPNIELVNDNTPAISRMQIELLVNSLANNLTNVATLQFMRSVGQARMRWLGIQEGHHLLSHEPDSNKDAYEKLKRINHWFAGELAFLAKRLADTPVPERPDENLLDHTQVVWLNELGKGNTHSLHNIPFVLMGGGAGFQTNRAIDLNGVPHNRMLLSVAQGLGNPLNTFGEAQQCADGPLKLGNRDEVTS